MDVSGRPHEGWMTLIPLAILFGIVMIALGGPVAFMNTVANWFNDTVDWAHRFVRSF
jgi:hypothetical protein